MAAQVRSFCGHLDRVIEVALAANLETDLAVSGPGTVVVTYAATPPDPVLPVRACMSANVTLRFVLLYGVPAAAVDAAVVDIAAALRAGELTPLPAHRFPLDDIAAAHEAVENGVTGKVLVMPGDLPDLAELPGAVNPRVVGPAEEELRAEPVLASGAAARAAAAIRVE